MDIQVSVICMVYNHEKYLKQTLDGFVSQKTDFLFKVIVHDDASIDGSKKIIEEYAKKYPNLIFPIYQKENQYSKGRNILEIVAPFVEGKYIARCEGDDYWCDSRKLQKQYDIMENHPECSMCVHKVRRIYENGELSNSCYPIMEIKKSILNCDDFLEILLMREGYPFQTSSYFTREKIDLYDCSDKPSFFKDCSFGDIPLMLYMCTEGCIAYIAEEMSCYRMGSIGSWNERNKGKYRENLEQNFRMLDRFNEYTEYKFDEKVKYAKMKKEFYCLQMEKDYFSLIKKKYRIFFRKLSLKQQLFYVYKACQMFIAHRT